MLPVICCSSPGSDFFDLLTILLIYPLANLILTDHLMMNLKRFEINRSKLSDYQPLPGLILSCQKKQSTTDTVNILSCHTGSFRHLYVVYGTIKSLSIIKTIICAIFFLLLVWVQSYNHWPLYVIAWLSLQMCKPVLMVTL